MDIIFNVIYHYIETVLTSCADFGGSIARGAICTSLNDNETSATLLTGHFLKQKNNGVIFQTIRLDKIFRCLYLETQI